jgi:hypothetical protein
MDLVIGLIVLGAILWGLARLADFFEERSFVLWLGAYLAGGGLTIMILAAARTAGR